MDRINAIIGKQSSLLGTLQKSMDAMATAIINYARSRGISLTTSGVTEVIIFQRATGLSEENPVSFTVSPAGVVREGDKVYLSLDEYFKYVEEEMLNDPIIAKIRGRGLYFERRGNNFFFKSKYSLNVTEGVVTLSRGGENIGRVTDLDQLTEVLVLEEKYFKGHEDCRVVEVRPDFIMYVRNGEVVVKKN